VIPAGRWFEAYWNRRNNTRTISQHSVASEESDSEGESEADIEIEDDVTYLRSLDPKEWKEQDHYKVLGLQKLRVKATEDHIKKAYRKMVLYHHPDKRRSAGEDVRDTDSDYFTCITKAYETLGNVAKRRSYDSVDPEFDNSIPAVNPQNKLSFYKVFSEAFRNNARWSLKRQVPELGDDNTPFEDVDKFYTFWYNLESWREFSYLDEEEKEKGENRDERRWIEKQNKAARQRRKREETARIRQLVDNAYNNDPRILRHREQEKNKKEAAKAARAEAVRARVEEEARVRREQEEAERRAKEAQEAETKRAAEESRRAKEEARKALHKNREKVHKMAKKHNYYIHAEQEKIKHLEEVDKLCMLLPLDKLEEFANTLENSDAEVGRKRFLKEVKELGERMAREQDELLAATQKTSKSSSNSSVAKWAHDDLQLLIKAVNLFPAGTIQRWEVVANYINQHTTSDKTRNAKEVLAKAKDMQKVDTSLKDEFKKEAYNKFEKSHNAAPVAESAPSERFDTPAEQLGISPWTADEQRLLEQALKTYPASTPERWDRIADCVPGRSKKECMKRYKELAEMVRAKKAALAAAQPKAKK